MGFIRGALIGLFSFVLFLFLVLMNFCLALSLSLDYENLQPALKNSTDTLLGVFLNNNSALSESNDYCLVEKEYVFNYENKDFRIPCETIEEGKDSVVNYISDNFIYDIYYTEYDCEFWECVTELKLPLVLISEKAKIYWSGKFFLLAALSLVLFALIFLISNNRPTSFISVGTLIILSAIPFRSFNWFLFFLPKQISSIFSLFFTKAHSVFVGVLIFGILFLVIGILSKILKWDMKFSKKPSEKALEDVKEEVSKSEVRKIVKEELSKKIISKNKRSRK